MKPNIYVRLATTMAFAMSVLTPLAWSRQTQAGDLHIKFRECRYCQCQGSDPLEMRLPPGQVYIKTRIENWSPTNHTGYPSWVSYSALSRDGAAWTEWSDGLSGVSELRIVDGPGKRTPEEPKPGDIVLFEQQYQVDAAIDIKVRIYSQRYYDGSGACHQTASEHWLTVETTGVVTPDSPIRAVNSAPPAATGSIPGTWNWVAGQTLVVHTDGTFEVYDGDRKINDGQWDTLAGGGYRLTHRSGGWVDTVTLSSDGSSLDGTNNIGDRIQGTRR